nr:uncharacterized protein LOC117220074 isoform X1 [Megalopta genalis]
MSRVSRLPTVAARRARRRFFETTCFILQQEKKRSLGNILLGFLDEGEASETDDERNGGTIPDFGGGKTAEKFTDRSPTAEPIGDDHGGSFCRDEEESTWTAEAGT